MKPTPENIAILKKLGFTCDGDRLGESMNDWYSLDNGWGFRIDSIRDFKHLVKRLMKFNSENEGVEI